jgi:LysR family transcriptional regulator, glycine cleavage system transcriptional activator
MSLRSQRVFQEIVARMSFRSTPINRPMLRRAEELNVTPAAVGSLVRGLEAVVGVELFRRLTSSYLPIAGGAQFVRVQCYRFGVEPPRWSFGHQNRGFRMIVATAAAWNLKLPFAPVPAARITN